MVSTLLPTYLYGNTQSTGTLKNSFAYIGMVIAEEARLYYMNARCYKPEMGRFISEDSYRAFVTVDQKHPKTNLRCIYMPIVRIIRSTIQIRADIIHLHWEGDTMQFHMPLLEQLWPQ